MGRGSARKEIECGLAEQAGIHAFLPQKPGGGTPALDFQTETSAKCRLHLFGENKVRGGKGGLDLSVCNL
jgi:hypothetical protein